MKVVSRDAKVLVWMPVYNEELYLAEALESVCSQSYQNMDILVSLNHCTDKSNEIAREFAGKDSRLSIIQPPDFMTSLDHAQWIRNYIIQNQPTPKYIVHLGGHDKINEDYVSNLVSFMENHSDYSLAYAQDAYAVDKNGSRLFRYDAQPETCRKGDFWAAFSVLTGIKFNIPAFGMIKYEIWVSEDLKPHCYALDHFLVAKYALLGRIGAVSGATLELRHIPPSNETYRFKHFGKSYLAVDNFFDQMAHLKNLLDESDVESHHKNILLGACSSIYYLRYKYQFKSQSEINDLMASDIGLGRAMEEMSKFGARIREYGEKESSNKNEDLLFRSLANLNSLSKVACN